jgi:hypothetical protein
MLAVADAVDAALAAGDSARRSLRVRGIDPDRCGPALEALEDAIGGLLVCEALDWPEGEWQEYLAAVRAQLEAAPMEQRRLPEPPKRASLALCQDLRRARCVRRAASGNGHAG